MIYEFAATQDLHGYDEPWAPGAGKNLFNLVADNIYKTSGAGWTYAINNDTLTVIVTTQASNWMRFKVLEITEDMVGKKYTQSFISDPVDNDRWFTQYNPSDNTDTIIYANPVTITEAMVGKWLGLHVKFVTVGTYTFSKIQVEEGSTATSYAPYENICPPEGFNIWNPTNAEYIQVYAGYVNANTRELYLRPVYQEYAGEELVGPWMSSMDEYSEDATPTEGAFVIDFGGELTSFEITPFMLQTLLDSLGIRQHFTDGAGRLNSLMDQAEGPVRSEEELLHLSRPLKVIAIGDQLPAGLTFKPISKDVLPGLPGKFIR